MFNQYLLFVLRIASALRPISIAQKPDAIGEQNLVSRSRSATGLAVRIAF